LVVVVVVVAVDRGSGSVIEGIPRKECGLSIKH
jgi:hypothetical protein